MAAIPGQPEPRPSDLGSPVPGNDMAVAAQAFMSQTAAKPPEVTAPANDIGAAAQAFMAQEQPAQSGYSGPGAGALQVAADWAPTVGAVAGGMAGLPASIATGGLASVGGAAAGGIGGESIKRLIEVNILGKPAMPIEQELLGDATEGIKQGLGQLLGLGVAKGLTSAPATKVGAAVVDSIANVVAKPLALMKGYVRSAYDEVTKPLVDIIGNKVTTLNTEQAGDAIKQLFGADIKQRFGGFMQSYSSLDNVAKSLPMGSDEVRLGFTNRLKAWALENGFGGDNYKMIQKYANDFNDAENGKQFSDIVQQLSSKAREAGQDGLRNQAEAFRALRDKAENFMESRTLGLARRVADGAASESELAAFRQMELAQGRPADQAVDQYVSTAKDYLKQRDSVKSAYAKFRGFLEDVGEQTRTRAEGRGPLQFVRDIQDVPSEKLVERMFDPKNAAALRAMQAETPQVFDQVVRSKMSQLVQKSSPNGTLDLQAFRRVVNQLPGSTRNILLSADEHSIMHAVLDNPKLAALDSLNKRSESSLISLAAQMAEIARIGTKAVGKATTEGFADSPLLRQAAGAPVVNTLVNAFGRRP